MAEHVVSYCYAGNLKSESLPSTLHSTVITEVIAHVAAPSDLVLLLIASPWNTIAKSGHRIWI